MKTLLAILFVALLAASAEAQQTVNINLAWTLGAVAPDGSNAPTGIKLERKVGTGTYAQIQQLAVVTSYADVITNDPGSTQYCYRVRAFNTAGNSAYSNEACGTSPVIKLPPQPPATLTLTIQ